jgi:hypothetical protein
MTTNHENSKKLHELGFGINNTSLFGWFSKKGRTVGRWIVADGIKEGYNFDFYSFDFETIWDALPTSVDGMVFGLEKTMIGYGNTKRFKIYEQVENQSLADCAAKLLITLAEQGIIKFK